MEAEKKKKEEARKMEEERKNLFKPVVVQKVAQGQNLWLLLWVIPIEREGMRGSM